MYLLTISTSKLYRKFNNCFSNYKPVNIISNTLNEGDIDVVSDEMVIEKDFQKSPTEVKSYESIDELKFPQEDEDVKNICDDIKEKK